MTDVDLNFLAKQQDRILSELAEMRIESRSTAASLRDDMSVLTAMVLRLENTSRSQREFNVHVIERVRKLENE